MPSMYLESESWKRNLLKEDDALAMMSLRWGPRDYFMGNWTYGSEAWDRNKIEIQVWELVETKKLGQFTWEKCRVRKQ